MDKPLVSIIIPIYNVERFLSKCLDSVINQTYTNLDILLVDDGSPDESGKICEEYAYRDKRITTIHKNNEGVVQARITGFKYSKGEYITFVDADDYIAKDAIEILVTNALQNNVDLVVASHYVETASKIELDKRTTRLGLYNKEDITELLKFKFLFDGAIGRSGFPLYLWGKIFKKQFLLGKLEKGEGISFAEDIISVFATMQEIKSMLVIKEPIYYYVSHENQITKKKLEDLWPAFVNAWKKLKELDKDNLLKAQLPDRIISGIASTLISISLRNTYKYYKDFINKNVHEVFIEELVWNNNNIILHSTTAKIYYTLLKKKLYYTSYFIGKYNLIDKAVYLYNYIR